MTDGTRSTVVAGPQPKASTAPPAYSALADLRPSDPSLLALWREVFVQLVDLHEREMAADGALASDKQDQAALNAEYERVCARLKVLERRLASEPARTFGDLVLRAAVARYWAGDDGNGQMHDLHDANDDAKAKAHLIRAILQVAGLPADERWQVALARTTRLGER